MEQKQKALSQSKHILREEIDELQKQKELAEKVMFAIVDLERYEEKRKAKGITALYDDYVTVYNIHAFHLPPISLTNVNVKVKPVPKKKAVKGEVVPFKKAVRS